MKNKKMLYLLIPGTLIVWGLIIFKILKNMSPEDNQIMQHTPVSLVNAEIISDTFSIHPTYRDPFLGRSVQVDNFSDAPVKNSSSIIKASLQWPVIIYGGIIKNQKSNKEMVLLQINGQGFMVKSHETVNGVTLFKVFRDSIEVHFSKEKKIIYK